MALSCKLAYADVHNKTQTNNESDVTAVDVSGGLSEPKIVETSVEAAQESRSFTERARTYIGDRYLNLVTKTDNFFAGDQLEREQNESFLKFETQSSFFENSTDESDFRLRGKFDLPHTKKRLKLFIDSDVDQARSIEDRGRGVSVGRDVNEDQTSAGLEFLRSAKPGRWRKSLQVGIKTGSSLDPFIRLRLRKRWELTSDWQANIRQDFWHLDEIGFGETTRVEFKKNIDPELNLRILSELEYRDEPEPLQYIHEWVLSLRLSEISAVSYSVGMLGQVELDEYAKEQFVAATYRRLIYKDWAFLSFRPELVFRDNEDWANEVGLTIRLEFFLTDN